MGPRYLKEGQDFGPEHFGKEFGFTGSSQGRHDPLPHPSSDDDEYGDGTYLAKTEAGPIARKRGGKVAKLAGGGPMMSTGFNPVVSPQGVLGRIAAKGKPARGFAKGGQNQPPPSGTAKDPTDWVDLETRVDGPPEHFQFNPRTYAQRPLQPGEGADDGGMYHGFPYEGKAEGGKFIQKMHLKKGALHRQLGVPESEAIPASKLRAAAAGRYGAKAEKRAHTAQMLKGLPRKRGKG